MAQNLAFGRGGGSSSWADDDDVDFQPIPAAPKIETVEEKQPLGEEEIEKHEQRRDNDGRERDNAHGARSGYDDRRDDRRGGYDDRRGGYNDRRGGYNDRRGGYDDRRDDRRGGYDDRRGGYEDRRGSFDEHHGGSDRQPREERAKNPVPDSPPFKIYVGNLPFRMNEDDLADFLGPEGIRDIHFPRDFESDRPKGYAYVEFAEREQLVRALELDGRTAGGRAIRIDVSDRERDRKPRQKETSWFTEKRQDRDVPLRRGRDDDSQRERRKLTLLPRTNSSDASKPSHSSIFGDAKPRDEAAYAERQKAREEERKKEAEERAKAKAAAKAKAKAEAEAAKAEAALAQVSLSDKKPERSRRKGSHDDVARQAGQRKNSHDDAAATHGPGRAGGRGRGGRGDKAHPDRRAEGGRGRGEGGGGRRQQERPAPGKKEDAPAAGRKTEPRGKRTEPVKTKIAPPTSTKTKNAFDLLGGDSDSD